MWFSLIIKLKILNFIILEIMIFRAAFCVLIWDTWKKSESRIGYVFQDNKENSPSNIRGTIVCPIMLFSLKSRCKGNPETKTGMGCFNPSLLCLGVKLPSRFSECYIGQNWISLWAEVRPTPFFSHLSWSLNQLLPLHPFLLVQNLKYGPLP